MGSGNAKGRFEMALSFLEGSDKDIEQAVKWLDKAFDVADAGDVAEFSNQLTQMEGLDAQFKAHFVNKIGEKSLAAAKVALEADDPDYESIESLLKDLAEGGNAEAQYCLATVYRDAADPIHDNEKYAEWLQKAAANGWEDAKEELENAAKLTDEWVAHVGSGPFDSSAYCMAGMEYRAGKTLRGLPHEKDILKAIEFYEKGFDAGDTQCARELSDIFETGDGVQSDLVKAHEWMLRAAEKGDSTAMVIVAYHYKNGHGISKDAMKAVSWFRKAAEAGSVNGQAGLGDCFKYGWGVAKDNQQAAKWYEKAIAPDKLKFSDGTECEIEPSYDAMQELAELLLDGNGIERDENRGVELIRKAAESGQAKAQLLLGSFLINPSASNITCIEQDIVAGVKWIQKSAEQSFGMAECSLATLYVQGVGVEKDLAKAKELYTRALEHGGLIKEMEDDAREVLKKIDDVITNGADDDLDGLNPDATAEDKAKFRSMYKKAIAGDAEAQADLAQAFYYGWEGAVKDYDRMLTWFSKSAEQGYAFAQRRLGICYEDGDGTEVDYDEALKWYSKAAEQGDCVSQIKLGDMYFNGIGVEEDNESAVRWYRMGAEQGDDKGQYMLGICYYNGYGVDKDEVEAVKWFVKSAEQDYSKAQCKLGDCCRLGKGGLEKSDEQAVEWYKKSADSGNAIAEYWMAEFYEDGRGSLEKDQAKSFEWRLKSAKHGDRDSMNAVGWAYQKGLGSEIDADKAVEWYEKGVEKGSAAAMNNLAKCYEDAFGVDSDIDKAFELFQKSAEKGFSRGCYHLGRFYENGLGCEANTETAKEWYQKAADKGDKDAKAALERIG